MVKKWEIIDDKKIVATDDQVISALLNQRDVSTKKQREEFFHVDLTKISFKSVGIDKEQVRISLERLSHAWKNQELVIVYGDYDVDGITGAAILWETLRDCGFNAMPYIPHRVNEGYGLSQAGIDNLLAKYPTTKLIITVDNGIVAFEAVAYARSKKLDVIITDHHLPDGQEKPQAYALVHTTKLCGAGVVWLLSKEVKKKFEKETTSPQALHNAGIDCDTHLELAALGTICDLVPLTHANRAIVKEGLERLRSTERIGLVELINIAGISKKDIGVYEIGHVLGPRLNASGRLESAMDSLRLLCTHDPNRARLLALKLDSTNTERQRITKAGVEHAIGKVRTQMSEVKKILIISDKSYEEGTVGLIASRLVEEFYRPAIVISQKEKISKGSVRSVSGFNIIKFLRSNSEFFINVGGHPMAAGFSIISEKIDTFRLVLEESAEAEIDSELLQKQIKIDLEIPFNLISEELFLRLSEFEPFGIGNPQPVFLSRRVLVREKRVMGSEGKHLRLILQGGEVGRVFEAVAFGMGERSQEIREEDYIDIVYSINMNEWKGSSRLQLKIKDFRAFGQ